jgi:hypothetical protein
VSANRVKPRYCLACHGHGFDKHCRRPHPEPVVAIFLSIDDKLVERLAVPGDAEDRRRSPCATSGPLLGSCFSPFATRLARMPKPSSPSLPPHY